MRVALLALLTSLALAAPAAASTFRAPIEPPTIDPGCDFGSTSCAYPDRHHTGIDFLGDDPPNEAVRATADGFVRVAATEDESHGFGHAVILEHRLGDGREVYSLYGHLAEPPALTLGQCVARGASFGIQGDTGDTENVSLHFELKRGARFGPPYGYSARAPEEYGYFDPHDFFGTRAAKDVCTARAAECATGGRVRIVAPKAGAELPRRHVRIAGRALNGPDAAGCPVELALRRDRGYGCAWWRPHHRAAHAACDSRRWFKPARADASGHFEYTLPRALTAGLYRAYARLLGQPRTSVHFRVVE